MKTPNLTKITALYFSTDIELIKKIVKEKQKKGKSVKQSDLLREVLHKGINEILKEGN